MTKVSVIVPVYNAECYLDECIQSVLNQKFTDWELLLVNDGSTDSSDDVCRKYSLEDPRIKVINKTNSGVSATRNLGLSMCSGEYVMFLDADDYWCDRTFLGEFVGLADSKSLDVVRGEYKAVDPSGNDLPVKERDGLKRMSENRILDSSTFLDNVLQREFFLPLCLIRKDLIRNIEFNTGMVFLEDVEFFLQILLKPLRCLYSPVCFYAYRKHNSSASNNFNKKRLSDAFHISALYRDLSMTDIDGKLAGSFRQRSWDYYWLTLRTMATEDSYFVNRRQLCEELNLCDLRRSLSEFMPSIATRNKWIHKLSPLGAVSYFRLRNIIGNIYRSFKSK